MNWHLYEDLDNTSDEHKDANKDEHLYEHLYQHLNVSFLDFQMPNLRGLTLSSKILFTLWIVDVGGLVPHDKILTEPSTFQGSLHGSITLPCSVDNPGKSDWGGIFQKG